jgi:hypothetical protein
MLKEKAIIIAANLKGDFKSGPDIGSILAHASHIEKEGAVLWSIVPPGKKRTNPFPHPGIRRGYFYNVSERAVTHMFTVEYIKAGADITEKRKAFRYLPDVRKPDWKDWRNYFYWLKITGIYRLRKDHTIRDFKKISDKKPLQYLRNYSPIIDPKFAYYQKKVTRREIMSDYIGDLLVAGKVTENDIEGLFLNRLADTLILKDRQGSFKKAGRLDLLFENRSGNFILYELKKDIAKISALDQIKRYMKASMKKYKIKRGNIKGIILAKSIDPELYQTLKKETNIEARTYYFSIELK